MPRYGKGLEVFDMIDTTFKSKMMDPKSPDEGHHRERLGGIGDILQNFPIICGGLCREKLPREYCDDNKIEYRSIEYKDGVIFGEQLHSGVYYVM